MTTIFRIFKLCHKTTPSSGRSNLSSSGDGSSSDYNNKKEHSNVTVYGPITLLITSCVAYEVTSVLIMSVISGFYLAISSQDLSSFLTCLWQALLVVTVVSMCQSIKMFAIDMASLQWRTRLVTLLHSQLSRIPEWTLLISNRIENIDQRMTQDISRLTKKLSTVISSLVTTPAIILYYTYYLTSIFGVIAPLACYLYFIIGAISTRLQAAKIIPIVYKQEAQEGDFRAKQLHFKLHQENILFLNGHMTELSLLRRSFRALVATVEDLIYTQLPLNLIVNWFSYFGSIGM